MSSMFKKKGGLAFKPKAPVARARPSSAATAAKPTPTPTPAPAPQSAIEVPPETTLEIQTQPQAEEEEEAEAAEKGAPTRPARRRDSHATVGEEPKEKQKESPAESRRTTRRASHSQHSDTALAPPIPPTATGNEATQSDEATELNTVVAFVSAKVAPQPEATTPGSRTRRQSPSRASIETSTDKSTPSTEEFPAPKPTESLDQGQNAPPADSAEEPAVISAPEPAPKRTTRTPSATAAGNATPDGEAVQGEPSRPRKRQRRTAQQGNGESRTPTTRKRKSSAPNANASRSSSRRARSITPDDAETQLVDLQKLKMSDLTKDLRIGKKFSRHDELRERERKARSKAKLEKDGETRSEAGDDSTNNNNNNNNNNNDKTSQLPAPDGTRARSSTSTGGASASNPAATSGPQFRIVDGQIVVDQDSLVMDRHARAAAAQAGEAMETIEENDFTHLITSSSFMNTSKLKGPNIWTEPETELFYRGLRMFGTEFEMISKMFPGKQRRHVKLKFNREERHNPERIDAAVMGEKTIKMDIDEYRAFTGAEFESVEAIEAEQRKIQEGYEAERQRVADEQAEIMRKKREELFADDDDQGAAGKKKKKGKRKGKLAVSYGLNGEPIVHEG